MEFSKQKNNALVVFGKDFPASRILQGQFRTIIADTSFRGKIEALGSEFINIAEFVLPGSIYEASAFLEELSHLSFPDDTRLPKSFVYKGFELWWLHYENLFLYFCLPYTQYKNLLEYVKDFQNVYFYCPPYKSLFSCYLQAHGSKMEILKEKRIKSPSILPFGILVQILITLASLPVLMIKKHRAVLFTGDKFEKDKDYDFRMRFVYEEMRHRNISFVEFIRGLESWRTVLQHAFTRKRPVIYSEAVAFLGMFLSIFSGGRRRAKNMFDPNRFAQEKDPNRRFKFLIATQYLFTVYDDIWAIRIMKWILRAIGIRVAFITAATKRNFHTVLGCKLNNIPTVGILHGVASRFYNVYDFLPGFDGEKLLSVDRYGLWSEWWKEYYLKYSDAYRPEQLFVSGPMRPPEKRLIHADISIRGNQNNINVLLVSEIVAVPEEIVPYMDALMKAGEYNVYIKFRQHRDSFEEWLIANRPDILNTLGKGRALKGNMNEAIELCDVVIGSQSTGVIEATLQLKPFIFFNTNKWGDYYGMTESERTRCFFAENPKELIERIKNARALPRSLLVGLQKQYFGDSHKNGSKWAVDQVARLSARKDG